MRRPLRRLLRTLLTVALVPATAFGGARPVEAPTRQPAAESSTAAPPCKALLRQTLNGIGLNVASWLGNAERVTPSPADLRRIREAGFRYVRLPFNPEYLGFDAKNFDPNHPLPRLRLMDKAVQQLNEAGLYVLLDMHTARKFRLAMEDSADLEDKITETWRFLGQHYGSRYNKNQIGFQLLNEPQYYNGKVPRWNALQRRFWKAVRAGATEHLIVAAPAMGGDRKTLKLGSIERLPDPAVVYGIPFYEPMIITHQGDFNNRKDTSRSQLGFIYNLAYPSAAARVQTWGVLKGGNRTEAEREVARYMEQDWGTTKLAERFQPARDWAAENKTCLFVTEFGTIRTLDPASRLRWLSDAVQMLQDHQEDEEGKKDKVPAALWDFGDNFGVTVPKGNPRDIMETEDGALVYRDQRTESERHFLPGFLEALGMQAYHHQHQGR